jgi:hypothetical protein
MTEHELSDEERRTLWEQFVEVYAHSQESYDSSIRTLAAAGVGVAVSLAAALESLNTAGVWAIVLFLSSLGWNLGSYATAQLDMRTRIACLRDDRHEGLEGNRWTVATRVMNVAAGAALIAGGGLLALFVSSET